MFRKPKPEIIIAFFKANNLYTTSLDYLNQDELLYIVMDLGIQWQLVGFETQYLRIEKLKDSISLN